MLARGIPAGFDGEIRRAGSGNRLTIDHAHGELECNLVLCGFGSYLLDARLHQLRPGVLVWLMPGERHSLVRSPSLEMWVVHARPDLADDDFRRDIAANPVRQLAGDDAVELDRLLTQVSQDVDEPALFNSGLRYALGRARRASRDSARQGREALHPAVLQALLILRSHAEVPSLERLAAACGISHTYLGRLLVQQTGRGFVEWRNRTRLERFHLAYAGSQGLIAAALDAGFGSYGQFHRVFQELMGVTPGEWVQDGSKAAPDLLEELPHVGASEPAETKPLGRGRRKQLDGGARLPALPSAHKVLPCFDGSERTHHSSLAGLVLPAVRRWVGPEFMKDLLEAGGQEDGALDRTRYLPEPDRTRPMLRSLADELGATDPDNAGALALALKTQDVPGLYASVTSPYGLTSESVADVATAYLAVAWVAANSAPDPDFAQVQALRHQSRRATAECSALVSSSDDGRQEAALAFMCQFAAVYNALMSARANGNPGMMERISDAVLRGALALFGHDLRALELSEQGFRPFAGAAAKRSSSRTRRRRGISSART